jgi:hypothetical protein
MMMYRSDDLLITSHGHENFKPTARCTFRCQEKILIFSTGRLRKGYDVFMKKINITYHEDRRIDQCQIKGAYRSDIAGQEFVY